MPPIFLNNVSSTVQAGSSAIGSASATGINVASGAGAKFGSPGSGQYVPCVIVDTTTSPETVHEYVWVTARSSDALTVTRQAESSGTYPASTTSVQSGFTIAAVATATALDSFFPVVNVRDYGAVGDGSTDDSTAINNAIAALPTTGGTVYFPAGDYAIASTVNLGNGTSSALSSRQGVYLVGAAGPLIPVASNVVANGYGAVRLKWTGAAGGTAVQVNGPLTGWGIKNIYLDASGIGVAGNGLVVVSAQAGVVENLAVIVANGSVGILTKAVAPFGGFQTNTMHNSWRNIFVAGQGGANDTRCIYINGSTATTANTCYDRWENVAVQMAAITSAGIKIIGIELQSCDNVRFRDVHFMPSVSTGSVWPLYFNYGVVTGAWPADCLFEGVDFGSNFTAAAANNGTPSGATPNRVLCVSTANGPVSNPTLTNLDWGYSNSSP